MFNACTVSVFCVCVSPVSCLFLCSCAESHTTLLFSLFPIEGHYISFRPHEEIVPMFTVHLTAACRDLFFCTLCRVMQLRLGSQTDVIQIHIFILYILREGVFLYRGIMICVNFDAVVVLIS